jgi:type IV secretory pathway TrbF-like protein
MATSPKTPIYEDQLVAWHNQRLWWLLIGAAAVIATLTVALCIVILRPHNAPYVLEVDGKGEPTGIIQPFEQQTPVADHAIRWALAEYIQRAFSVVHNFPMDQVNLKRVYAMSTGQATDALTAYYRANHDANNPLFVQKYWQQAKPIRILKLPAKDTYQVDYIIDRHDNDHPRDGVQTNWRATMRVVQGKPTLNNILGVWVTDLDFQPEAK